MLLFSLFYTIVSYISLVVQVYDITDKESFENVKEWLKEIDRCASRNVNKLLVGNKSDMTAKREVEYEEALAFAEEMGIPLIETSAKASTNVQEAFLAMGRAIRTRMTTSHVVEEGDKGSINIGRGESLSGSGGGDKGCC